MRRVSRAAASLRSALAFKVDGCIITKEERQFSGMPTAFRWKEVKHALSWKVTWDVRMPNTDDGARAGKYLLVGDQRSQQLSKKPKLFMTQMVGRMMKVGPSTTSKPEVRRALGEWREASGTGNLSGGVARVSHYGKVTE